MGAQQGVIQRGGGFGPQIVEEGAQGSLQGAAAHEGSEPVNGIGGTGLDPRPPGQTQPIGNAAHGPEEGVLGQGLGIDPL